MHLRKVIISLTLLLVYSLGFAHNLIPHCHELENSDTPHVEIGHDHHSHASEYSLGHNEHQHVDHVSADHCDEGLCDCLFCVLSEMQPHDHGADHVHFVQQTKPISKSLSFELALPPTKLNLEALYSSHVILDQQLESNYFTPLIDTSPLRGPPTVSC